MPSSRRTLLASIAAGVTGLAGCATSPGSGPGETPTETATQTPAATTPLGDPVTLGDTTVTVDGLVHRHSFRYLSAPDAFGVSVADGQFVFVGVEADGDAPASGAFALVAGDGRYGARTFRDYGPADGLSLPHGDQEYSTDDPAGYLAFEVPAPLDAAEVAVVLAGDGDEGDDARWTVPESALAPLRSPPPSFAVSYDDVPGSVDRSEPLSVTLTVTNEGDGDGVFRGAINHTGPLYGASPFSVPLAAGESRTHELVVDYYVDEDFGTDRIQFEVMGPGTDRSFRVELTGESTETATATPDDDGTATATPDDDGTATATKTETGTNTGTTRFAPTRLA